MEIEKSIEATKAGFEESFKQGDLYNKQTQDVAHLQQILELIDIQPGEQVLDLGTGSGYLTFAMAEQQKDAKITGLDIVEETLKADVKVAEEKGLENVSFVCYDGVHFPFADKRFDLIATRYCLHHFPALKDTFQEIARTLTTGGRLFISDPTPNEGDEERFVDDYMQMKKDGHIQYYTRNQWITFAAEVGLELVDDFMSTIRFPRQKETAIGFDEIMKKHNKDVIRGYDVQVTEDDKYIYITQRVCNMLFQKK